MVRCNLKIIRTSKKAPQLDFKALRNTPEMQKLYSIEVQNRFSELISNDNDIDEMDPEAKWTKLEKVLVESADKIIPKNQP